MKKKKIYWVNLLLLNALLINSSVLVFAEDLAIQPNENLMAESKTNDLVFENSIPDFNVLDETSGDINSSAIKNDDIELPKMSSTAKINSLASFNNFSDDTFVYEIIDDTCVRIVDLTTEATLNLIEVVIPNKASDGLNNYFVTEIGSYAFQGNTQIVSVDLSQATALEVIEDYAFKNCHSLITNGISGSSSLKSIGAYAYEGCIELTETGLSSNSEVQIIGNGAFLNCLSLIHTGLSENYSVTTIGNGAFEGCKSLIETGLSNNNSVTSLSSFTFKGCISLVNTGLEKNNSIQSIGDYAFEGCVSLEETGLLENTTIHSIGEGAFLNCKALNGDLVLNNQIKNIGGNAFNGTQFEQVYWLTNAEYNTQLSLGNYAFDFVGKKGVLYIPETFLNDALGQHSTFDNSLVSMKIPQISISDVEVERNSEDTAKVSFVPNASGIFVIKSGDRVLKQILAVGNVDIQAELDNLTPFETEITIVSQATYPNTAEIKSYNTVFGTAKSATIDIFNYKLIDDFDEFVGTGVSTARISSPKRLFKQLKINNEIIDSANYELSEGSTVISLKETYLKALVNGVYPVQFELATGQIIETTLTVNIQNEKEAPKSENKKIKKNVLPKTGSIQSMSYFYLGATILVFAYTLFKNTASK